MIHCKDCKHWTPPEEANSFEIENGLHWSYDKEIILYGHCETTKGALSGPENKGQMAYASDAENMSGFLCTLPEFGCVLGKPKC